MEDGDAGLDGRAASTWKSCKNDGGLVWRVLRRNGGGVEEEEEEEEGDGGDGRVGDGEDGVTEREGVIKSSCGIGEEVVSSDM